MHYRRCFACPSPPGCWRKLAGRCRRSLRAIAGTAYPCFASADNRSLINRRLVRRSGKQLSARGYTPPLTPVSVSYTLQRFDRSFADLFNISWEEELLVNCFIYLFIYYRYVYNFSSSFHDDSPLRSRCVVIYDLRVFNDLDFFSNRINSLLSICSINCAFHVSHSRYASHRIQIQIANETSIFLTYVDI